MDDTTRQLLRFVARSFYGKPHVLVMDAILLHSVLSEDDLSYLLGIQKKELRSLCNKLVEDRLLTSHTQREDQANQFRAIQRVYYFIHYTEAIDSIKWKVHSLAEFIKKDLSADANPQGFICPVCKTKYSQLDAMSLMSFEKDAFLCGLCGVELIEDDSGAVARENQLKYSKLMRQLEPVIGYLKIIDETSIPENNFETSLAKIIPVQATSTASYTVSNIGKGKKMFDRNSYLNNQNSINAGSKSQATLHVSITTNDENTAREKRAVELEEKRKQNALPEWHEESTIGKALGKLDEDQMDDQSTIKTEGETTQSTDIKTEHIKTDSSINVKDETIETVATAQSSLNEDQEAQDVLAAYYEQVQQKAQKEAEEEAEEEEEEEEEQEDEDEFEDVELEDVDFGEFA